MFWISQMAIPLQTLKFHYFSISRTRFPLFDDTCRLLKLCLNPVVILQILHWESPNSTQKTTDMTSKIATPRGSRRQ